MARFRTRSRSFRRPLRRPLSRWWKLCRVPMLIAILCAVWWFGVRPAADEAGWVRVTDRFSPCGAGKGTAGCVIDGDTLWLAVREGRPRRIRITGFDAPELDGACEAEQIIARKARAALSHWLDHGPFEWSGADAPAFDQYGRELRAIRRTSRGEPPEYLAEVMVEAGLAYPSGWGAAKTHWCR